MFNKYSKPTEYLALNREIRVFLSSTFKDMEAERNYLVNNVFPEVRAECAKRMVGFTDIDLRWGITEEEAKNGETIAICLSEIDRCRLFPPFFIGFIGERYGWTPTSQDIQSYLESKKDIDISLPPIAGEAKDISYYRSICDALDKGVSVTELEFNFGVLNNRNNGLFFLRDKTLTDNLYQQSESLEREDFYDLADGKLESLKSNIRKNYADMLALDGYKTIEDFGDQVKKFLLEALEKIYPENTLSIEQKARLPHALYAWDRLKSYVPNYKFSGKLLDYLESRFEGNEKYPCLVLGESGIGKSSLLAHLASSLKEKDKYEVLDFYSSIGGVGSIKQWATVVEDCLQLPIEQLKSVTALQFNSSESLWEKFSRKLCLWQELNPDKYLILLLDAVNQLSNSETTLRELQSIILPEKVAFIVSSTPDISCYSELWNIEKIPVLDRLQIVECSNAYLKNFSKTLPDYLLRKIASNKKFTNPLRLKITLEQLRINSSHEQLEQNINFCEGFDSLEELFVHVIKHLDNQFSDSDHPNVVIKLCGYLAISRNGLSEFKLGRLLTDDSERSREGKVRQFPTSLRSKILSALNPYLLRYGGKERLMHPSLIQAALSLINETEYRLSIVKLSDLESSQDVVEKCYQLAELIQMNYRVKLYLTELMVLVGSLDNCSKILKFDRSVLEYALDTIGFNSSKGFNRVENIIRLWNRHGIDGYKSLELKFLSYFAKICSYMANKNPAIQLFGAIIELEYSDGSRESADVTYALEQLGHIYTENCKYDQAFKCYKEAIRINKTNNNHLKLYGVVNLANLLMQLDSITEARKLYQQVVNVAASDVKNNSAVLEGAYLGLSACFRFERNFSEAIEFCKLAIRVKEDHLPITDYSFISAKYNLAMLLMDNGNLLEADNAFWDALDLTKSTYGDYNDLVANLLNLKGSLEYRRSNHNKSLSFYLEALAIRKKVFLNSNIRIAQSLMNIGNCYRNLGNIDKALLSYEEAVAEYRKVLNKKHSEFRQALQIFSETLYSHGQLQRAKDVLNDIEQD